MYSLTLYKAACVDADQQGLPVQDKDFSLKVLFEYLKKCANKVRILGHFTERNYYCICSV